MTQLPSNASLVTPTLAEIVTADNGSIRIGGGYRLPPSEIADSARVCTAVPNQAIGSSAMC